MACSSTSSGPGHRASSAGRPVVLAAASLSRVLPRIDARATYGFGGSDSLATQIEQGAPADVYAAASPKQPAALYARGLVGKPVRFATNTLVLIVPRSNPAGIHSALDLTRRGTKLVVCQASVPCGDYARRTLAALGIARRAMRNVVSETTDVTQTLAAVALGQADAGFVYLTDAEAARGKVAVIRLPARAKPRAADVIAVVSSAAHRGAAVRFVREVLSRHGQTILRAAGFGAP